MQIGKTNYSQNIRADVTQVVDQIGGWARFIKPGETVLIKPNFNTADPFPASSDIHFIKAVVELVYEHGAKKVIVGESCTFTQKTNKVMDLKGIELLKEIKPEVEVVNFDKGEWVKKKIPGAKFLRTVRVPRLLDEIDRLILLPCLKTHMYAQYTGALKLSVGLMHKRERLALHSRYLQEKVAELNLIIKPDLIIMDARKCFITRGPSDGEVREPSLIMASDNRVAIDVEGIKTIQSYPGNTLAGIKPEELTQIKYAMALGL